MSTYVRPQWRAASNVKPAIGTEVSGSGRPMRVPGMSLAHMNMINPGLGFRLGLTS